jgi:hypothetical protein
MKKIRNTQKNKKNNSRMTPKEAFEYYFIKHPFELLIIILFMAFITLSIAIWDFRCDCPVQNKALFRVK